MIKNIFNNRWFLFGLGFLCFVIVVWFVGPLVAIAEFKPLASSTARLVLIVLVLLLWAGLQLYRYLQTQKASKELLAGMIDPSEQQAAANAQAEVAQLQQRINQAIATLEKQGSGRKWGKSYLYEIPWYLFIGAPGSGKTTALMNCGLRFPVADGAQVHAVRGVGGTRNCDWWFTDDAIFLDTAGRYTTQDSDQRADSAAWLGFLKLLRKTRARRPLNGVIVTLSITDLLSQSEAERDQYAMNVRQRIQELREQLGVGFAVYLMVSKADLLAGFSEFFAHFSAEERSQVFGNTFVYQQTQSKDFDFEAEFQTQVAELEQRLNARLIDRLQQERDTQRRAQLYLFPQQFALATPLIKRFIGLAFQESRFDQKVLLRGVYFSSATQEGTPIDRVLGSLSRLLKIEKPAALGIGGVGKSYFLTRLLKELVFPEAALVSFDAQKEARRRWALRVAYAFVALVTVLLSIGWAVSYLNNQRLIENSKQQISQLAEQSRQLPPPAADDWQQVLPFLNQLRNMPFGYGQAKQEPGLSLSLGLYQGDRLAEMLQNTYGRSLGLVLLPRVALLLEQQIRHGSKPELQYEALKAYLMLFDNQHREPDALVALVAALWEARYQQSSTELVAHLQAAMVINNVQIAWRKDEALVQQARLSLAATSLPDRVFARMQLMGVADSITPVKLSDWMGPAGTQIFERSSGEPLSAPLPALFTYEGYHKGFNPTLTEVVKQMAAEDRWVLGEASTTLRSEQDKALLHEAVKRRYLEEYIRHWDAVLSSIRLKPSSSINDTLMLARTLSALDSPLKKLLLGLNPQLTLSVTATSAVEAQVTDKVLKSAKDMAAKLIGDGAAQQALPQRQAALEKMVDEHFAGLRQLAPVKPGQPAPIDQTLVLLNEFYQELSGLATGMQGPELKPMASVIRLKAEADRLPVPLGPILASLFQVTKGQAAAANKEAMDKAVGGAGSFCAKAIAGRYPVSRGGADMAIADFASVFGPGGELESFFNSSLKSVVDTSGSSWKLLPNAEATAPVSAAALRQFQNADTIRRTFFRGSAEPQLSVDLKLLSSDWPQLSLEFNGEVRQLSAGGSSLKLKWPTDNSNTIKLAAASGTPLVVEGDWALFRLVDKLNLEAANGDRLRLAYQADGKKAVLEIRAGGVFNPFRMAELRGFQCPGK